MRVSALMNLIRKCVREIFHALLNRMNVTLCYGIATLESAKRLQIIVELIVRGKLVINNRR